MEMDTEENSSSRHRRIITVKKKKPATTDHGGICKFDEYIQRSGLEPKSYQREGVEFCLYREQRRCAAAAAAADNSHHHILGGIIADEMGLGKTIMMMGLILANITAYRRTLIVVPVALIAQWVAQIKKTIIDTGVKSDLTVFVYHGATAKRSVILSGDDTSSVWCHRPPKRGGGDGSSRAIDIVITTYGCVAMEEPAAAAVGGGRPPKAPKAPKTPMLSLLTFNADRVIFDEAHHLRNKSSRIFKGAMRVVVGGGGGNNGKDASLAVVTRRRPSVWIVTGTPIQNKISDLKSLCYILGFGVGDLITEEKRKAIRDQFVLRRTKVSVGMIQTEAEAAAEAAAEDNAVTCAPRLQSLAHYKTNVAWASENELDLSHEIHKKARNTTDRAERLKLYTRMRQMCVWPALLQQQQQQQRGENIGRDREYADDLTYGLSLDQYNVAVSKQSKIDRIVDTMTREAAAAAAANGGGSGSRKSIVFCHYRREMTQLRDMLLRSGVVMDGNDIAIIDGTVGARERGRIFAAVPTVLILQIRTCSEGLNLQSYSDVYFVSPHWNPCVEDQAIARCYRMGQTQGVRVFRFYMTDFVVKEQSGAAGEGESECISTLDHKCEEIQERKRVLCNEFLQG
jgi:SNF2 family DNA or RNA helicase